MLPQHLGTTGNYTFQRTIITSVVGASLNELLTKTNIYALFTKQRL